MPIRSMLAVLADHPHEYAEVRDDKSAVALLQELLIADKFIKNPTPAEEWFGLVMYADHDTHFLVAVRFEGFKNAIDNGHVIHCFPKSQFTARKVEAEISKIYGPVIGTNDITTYWLPSPNIYN